MLCLVLVIDRLNITLAPNKSLWCEKVGSHMTQTSYKKLISSKPINSTIILFFLLYLINGFIKSKLLTLFRKPIISFLFFGQTATLHLALNCIGPRVSLSLLQGKVTRAFLVGSNAVQFVLLAKCLFWQPIILFCLDIVYSNKKKDS